MLKDNYGIKDNDRAVEARMNALYEELGKRERYAAYEEGVYERIAGLIETSPEEGIDVGAGKGVRLRKEVFKPFFGKVYVQLGGRGNEALAVGRRCAEVRHAVLSSRTRIRR